MRRHRRLAALHPRRRPRHSGEWARDDYLAQDEGQTTKLRARWAVILTVSSTTSLMEALFPPNQTVGDTFLGPIGSSSRLRIAAAPDSTGRVRRGQHCAALALGLSSNHARPCALAQISAAGRSVSWTKRMAVAVILVSNCSANPRTVSKVRGLSFKSD